MKKIILLLLLINQMLFAQDGIIDSSFNPTAGANDTPWNILVQPDGKIVIVGFFSYYNGVFKNHIARLNADASLDTGFSTGSGSNFITYTSSLQADGKIIIGGLFVSYNGFTCNHIARLNADGTFDATFNTGIGTNNALFTSCIQPDGKILIGGTFFYYNNITKNNIARLNTDGSLDNTFNTGTGPNGEVYKVIMQPDGKILIGGLFTSYNGIPINRLARLNSDGSLDNSFNPGTGPDLDIKTIVLQNDGKIIIAGFFSSYNGISINKIARINTNGTLDTSFNQGAGPNDNIYTAVIQPDQKIIIGGWFTNYNGIATNRVARLNTNGNLDSGFMAFSGASDKVFSSAIQQDGKIIFGGNFTFYNNLARPRIVRVNSQNLSTTTHTFHELEIVPNPARFDINLHLANTRIESVVIADMTGKTVLTETQDVQKIHVEHLASGVYIIQVFSEDGKFQAKFIKE